jgi:hypothetical protein
MQYEYVFHDVSQIQIITYFYGWCTVLETLGPWCLPDKKLVVPREKLKKNEEPEGSLFRQSAKLGAGYNQ